MASEDDDFLLQIALEESLEEATRANSQAVPPPPPVKRENIDIDWNSMDLEAQLDLVLALSTSGYDSKPGITNKGTNDGKKKEANPQAEGSPGRPQFRGKHVNLDVKPAAWDVKPEAWDVKLAARDDPKSPLLRKTNNPQELTPPKGPAPPRLRMKGILVRSDPQSGTIYKGTMADKKVMRSKMREVGINYENITSIDSTQRASAPGVTMKHDILKALKSSVEHNDHVVFSYTGHGREGDGALALRRGQALTANEFLQTWVDSAMNQDGSFKSSLTVVNDSCFSGNWEEHARMFIAKYPGMRIEVLSASNGKTTSNAYEDGSALTNYGLGYDDQKYWNESDAHHRPQALSNNMTEEERLIGVRKRGEPDDGKKIMSVASYMHKRADAGSDMRKDNLVNWARELKEEGWLEGALETSNKDSLAKRINKAVKKKTAATDEEFALALQRKEENKFRSEAALEGWETRRENEEFEKRSELAKKGWKTRRENEKKREVEDAALACQLAEKEGISLAQIVAAEKAAASAKAKRSESAKKGRDTRREKQRREEADAVMARAIGKEGEEAEMARALEGQATRKPVATNNAIDLMAAFERRSKAATRGWETRRANERERETAAAFERRSEAAIRGWETRRGNEALRNNGPRGAGNDRWASQRGQRGTRSYVDNAQNRRLDRVGKHY